jgi:hypothetical protein
MAAVAAMGDGSDDEMIVGRHPAYLVDTAELGSESCKYAVALPSHLCSDLPFFWCD